MEYISPDAAYVLFSPVSDRDPCSADPVYRDIYRDGALLHIVRKYRPQKAYLFLTERFQAFEAQDHRYSSMLEHVSPGIEIQFMHCPKEITNAALFDQFDHLFRDYLEQIHAENMDAQLLVNLSSGTPQMQASLYLLKATIGFKVFPIQVLTPRKDSNTSRDFYSTTLAENNLGEDGIVTRQDSDDNTVTFTEDRCQEVTCTNAVRTIMVKNITKLVQSYAYTAAKDLYENSKEKELFSPQLPILLKEAAAHLNLNEEGKKGQDFYEPAIQNASEEARRCYDYLLYLETLVKREAWNDYSRALSPVLTTIMRMRLKRAGYDILIFCDTDQNGVAKMKRHLLQNKTPNFLRYLDHQYWRSFKDGPLSAIQMLHYMEYLKNECHVDLEVKKFQKLRKAEETIRNFASHEMKGITEQQIQEKTGSSAEEILALLRDEYQIAIGVNSLKWNGLKRIEGKILAELDVNS